MRLRHPVLALLVASLSISCSDGGPTAPGDPGEPDPPGEDVVSREIGPEGGEITSEDGALTLTVPEGALSETETITIEQLGEEDLGEAFADVVDVLGVDGAWELGPDGLEFQEAVTARIASDQTPVESGDSVGVSAEFLFTLDDGSVAALDSLSTAVDTATGEVVVRGQTSHFTPLVNSKANNGVSFSVLDVPEMLEVNDSFEARARIRSSATGPLADLVTVEGPGRYTDDSGSPLAPDFSPLSQELTANGDGTFEGAFPYTCTDTGLGVYDADLSAQVTFELESGTVTAESFAGFLTTIDCVEAMPEQVALTVQKDGDGAGTVVSDPAGIDCGADCPQQEAEFDLESSVILSAEAAEGSVFDGWSGDIGDADPDAPTLTLAMDDARTVTATFSPAEEAAASIESFEFAGSTGLEATVDWTIQVDPDADPGDVGIELDFGDGTTSMPPSIGEQVDDDPPTFWGQADHTYDVPGEYEPSATLFFDGESVGSVGTSVVTEAPPEITASTGEFTGLRTIDFNFQMRWNGSLDLVGAAFDGDGDGQNAMDVPLERGADASNFMGKVEYEFSDDLSFPVMPRFEVTNYESGESNTVSGEVREVDLTVNKDGDGTGTVTGMTPDGPPFGAIEVIDCGSKCSQPYLFDPVFVASAVPTELTAEPDEGSVFAGWSGDLGGAPAGASTITVEMDRDRTVTATFEPEGDGNESCTEQPLEAGARFPWGGQVEENDPEGSTNVQATVDISGAAEFVPGTQDADRGTWTTFTPTQGVLDIGTTSGGEVVEFSFDVQSTGAGTATWTFSASDEGGVRGTVVCDFIFE